MLASEYFSIYSKWFTYSTRRDWTVYRHSPHRNLSTMYCRNQPMKYSGSHAQIKCAKFQHASFNCSLLKLKIPENREPNKRNTEGSSITINFHSSWGEKPYFKRKNLQNFADMLHCMSACSNSFVKVKRRLELCKARYDNEEPKRQNLIWSQTVAYKRLPTILYTCRGKLETTQVHPIIKFCWILSWLDHTSQLYDQYDIGNKIKDKQIFVK